VNARCIRDLKVKWKTLNTNKRGFFVFAFNGYDAKSNPEALPILLVDQDPLKKDAVTKIDPGAEVTRLAYGQVVFDRGGALSFELDARSPFKSTSDLKKGLQHFAKQARSDGALKELSSLQNLSKLSQPKTQLGGAGIRIEKSADLDSGDKTPPKKSGGLPKLTTDQDFDRLRELLKAWHDSHHGQLSWEGLETARKELVALGKLAAKWLSDNALAPDPGRKGVVDGVVAKLKILNKQITDYEETCGAYEKENKALNELWEKEHIDDWPELQRRGLEGLRGQAAEWAATGKPEAALEIFDQIKKLIPRLKLFDGSDESDGSDVQGLSERLGALRDRVNALDLRTWPDPQGQETRGRWTEIQMRTMMPPTMGKGDEALLLVKEFEVYLTSQEAAVRKLWEAARVQKRADDLETVWLDSLGYSIGQIGDPTQEQALNKDLDLATKLHKRANAALGKGKLIDAEIHLDKAQRIIYGIARACQLAEFKGNQTIQMQQEAFRRPDQDSGVLAEMQSEGVCLSMVLDWIGGGGSDAEPGAPIEGKITSKHKFTQNAYLLGGLLQDRVSLDLDKAGFQELLKKSEKIQKATELQLGEARKTARVAEQLLENLQQELSSASEALKRQEAGRKNISEKVEDKDPNKAEVLQLIQLEIDKLGLKLSSLESGVEETEEELQQARDQVTLLEKIALSVSKLNQEQIAEMTETLAGHLAQVTTLSKALKARASKHYADYPGSGPLMPSVMLEMYGVELIKTRENRIWSYDSSSDSYQVLPGSQVQSQFESELKKLPLGKTTGVHIYVVLSTNSGHAIGLNVKRPGEASSDDWDIELLDPNYNGYRYKKLSEFLVFIKRFYEKMYNNWIVLGLNQIKVVASEKRLDKDPSQDPSTVIGGSVSDAWDDDWRAISTLLRQAAQLKRMPEPVTDDLNALKRKIERLVPEPGAATEADWLIARTYLERLRSLCGAAIASVQTYQTLESQALTHLSSLPMDDPAQTAFVKAGKLFLAGDLEAAVKEIRGVLP
jgi:tetratricopeptide (TPR) repeat protein